MSPLAQQFQKVLNNISIQHSVGPFGVPGHSGVKKNEIANGLTWERNFQQSFSRQNTTKKIK